MRDCIHERRREITAARLALPPTRYPPRTTTVALRTLGVPLVLSNNDSVVPLVRLQRQLLCSTSADRPLLRTANLLHEEGPTFWLDALLPHVVDLGSKDLGGRCGRVDTVCLDGNDDSAAVLEEVMGVQGDDTGLIGLGNIGKDDVDHLDQHPVLLGVSGVLNNRDGVGLMRRRISTKFGCV